MSNLGVVYELTPSDDGWQESVIYSFRGSTDGFYPYAGVIFDKLGNLWGTTAFGGTYNQGTVFELTYVPGVGWQETVVYNFQNSSDGTKPFAGLVIDSLGNVYGAMPTGGGGGGGTVFQLSPSGNSYTFNVLYSFSGTPAQCGTWGSLTLDDADNPYGTTFCDGAYQKGKRLQADQYGEWLGIHLTS